MNVNDDHMDDVDDDIHDIVDLNMDESEYEIDIKEIVRD
jgi:hypothetical protein